MIKKITCIECPKGCSFTVDVENCKLIEVSDNECPKGIKYAKDEIENPVRILTTTVAAAGLPLRLIPVRTDSPIPKAKIFEAMAEIGKIKINQPVHIGDIIFEDLLGLGVNLIATRESYDK